MFNFLRSTKSLRKEADSLAEELGELINREVSVFQVAPKFYVVAAKPLCDMKAVPCLDPHGGLSYNTLSCYMRLGKTIKVMDRRIRTLKKRYKKEAFEASIVEKVKNHF